jgi:hypothetical protein
MVRASVNEQRAVECRREIICGANGASLALAVDDEGDVAKLAMLGLRLNVLRLGDCEYQPSAAAYLERT